MGICAKVTINVLQNAVTQFWRHPGTRKVSIPNPRIEEQETGIGSWTVGTLKPRTARHTFKVKFLFKSREMSIELVCQVNKHTIEF
jgi:hypothetical protein